MHLFKRYPFFLFLLPLFFVLHGYTEHYNSVPVKDAVLLALLYSGSALLIACIAWGYYRQVAKAALVAFALLAYYFFFGALQDALRNQFTQSFLARYSLLLPVSVLLFAVLVLVLKKWKGSLQRLLQYLNILLLVLLGVEAIALGRKIMTGHVGSGSVAYAALANSKTPKRSDLFFIVLDGYSGNEALMQRFGFDNSAFQNQLRNRHFYVIPNSRSNYNYTPFSIASMLNMTYLQLDMETKGSGNLIYCYRVMRNSNALSFLKANGYEFYNYSIFDFTGQPAVSNDPFLSTRTELITAPTLGSRLKKDILFNVAAGRWRYRPLEEKIVYAHLKNNNEYMRLTVEVAAQGSAAPKFVYTHLMMPHYPYYFDRQGRPLPFDSLVEGKQHSIQNYIEYLQYCNTRILQLTDSILQASSTPPIIILAGDHGFRHFTAKEDRKYCFMNLAAVYLPSRNYSRFYSQLSGVNLFPVLFNTEFGQHLPLQKDSTIYLWD